MLLGGDTTPASISGLHRSPEQWVGRRLGKYEITALLGVGGMGVVLKAHDPSIERDVAIKVLAAELSSDKSALHRFLAEAKSAGKLSHPNAVTIYEVANDEEVHYLVMEVVSGGSAGDHLEQSGAYTVSEATCLAIEACKGLAAAHKQGLVHRDVKPANLLLTENGEVKVADFGLAKRAENQSMMMTQAGHLVGTPYYMSPEQCEAAHVDARSDIYSLGATYYSLLTGQCPYQDSGSVVQVMFAHCNAGPPDPREVRTTVPAACAAIIHRAMATNPADRYQSMDEMRGDLEAILAAMSGAGIQLPSQSSATLVRPAPAATAKSRRSFTASLTAGAGLLALAGGGAAYFLADGLRGGGLTEPDGKGSSQPGSPEASASAASVQGVTDNLIIFGTTTAYSGPSRDLGQNMVLGIRTCFNAVNDAGGIHGRKLELVVLDDGYEPDRAIANMKELFEDRKVFAVIGNVGTPTAEVTVPYALENQRLFFAPYTGAGLLRQDPPDRYVFNYRASYADETAAMVQYFIDIKEISPDQIAVFAQNDAYGDDGFRGVVVALRNYGIREKDILRVGYERNSVQVSEAIERIVENSDRIQAIVMVPTSTVAARFIQQVKARGVEVLFGIVSFVGSDLLAEEFRAVGPEYGEGVIVTQVVPHFQSGATGVIRYRELLGKYYPEARPGFVSLEGFIAAECLAEGLKEAGPDLTTERLVDALESVRDLDLGVGPIVSFGPSRHQASSKVWGTILNSSGTFEMLELE